MVSGTCRVTLIIQRVVCRIFYGIQYSKIYGNRGAIHPVFKASTFFGLSRAYRLYTAVYGHFW